MAYKKEQEDIENITKEDFEKYEKVRISGVTNMLMVNVVRDYSNLSRDKVMTIMKNYAQLSTKFNIKENSPQNFGGVFG